MCIEFNLTLHHIGQFGLLIDRISAFENSYDAAVQL